MYIRSTALGHDTPTQFLRHTSEVLTLGVLTQRLVTGAQDGKVCRQIHPLCTAHTGNTPVMDE